MENNNKKKGKSLKSRINNSKKLKHGGFTTLLIIIVIAAVVLVNVGAVALTNAFSLSFDLTRNSKYTLSKTTKTILAGVDKKITIYAMYSSSLQESYPDITKLLQNIGTETRNVDIQYIDLTKNPAFANRFMGDTADSVSSIQEGSIIVTREDDSKFRVLTFYDLYSISYDSSYNASIDGFIGEESIINAVLYANSDNSPKVYWLSGHMELTSNYYTTMQSYLEKQNYECSALESTQLHQLESGDTLIVLAPSYDLSKDELEQLKEWMSAGGRMVYVSNVGVDLANFNELLSLYGVALENNLVYESSASSYYMLRNYLVPSILVHDTTASVRSANLRILMPNSRSITQLDVMTTGLTVTPILQSSATSYGKFNLSSDTVEKEAGDTDGPLNLAVAIEMVNDYQDTSKNTRLVVYGSRDLFLVDDYGNPDLFVQSVNWMQEEMEVVTIVGKSTSGDRLSFTSMSQIYAVQAVVLYVIPGLVIIAGIVVFIRRRHL